MKTLLCRRKPLNPGHRRPHLRRAAVSPITLRRATASPGTLRHRETSPLTQAIPCLLTLLVLVTGLYAPAQQPVAILRDKFLIPESITWNEPTGEFFVSSINRHKIVAVRLGGESRDFIQSGQDGFGEGLGLHIDPRNHVLWALSNETNGNIHSSGIWLYDPATAKLLRKWVWSDTAGLLLNDLTISNRGEVFITDSEGSKVYYLQKSMDHPRVLFTMQHGDYPNGIALSGDQRYLFIATARHGIVCYDRRKHRQWTMQAPQGTAVNGIDGLFFYRNSLIGVDNNSEKLSEHKITQFFLKPDNRGIDSSRIIDAHNPWFDIPTSAVIAQDSLYVLANSQLENMDPQKHLIRDTSVLKRIYILGYKLAQL